MHMGGVGHTNRWCMPSSQNKSNHGDAYFCRNIEYKSQMYFHTLSEALQTRVAVAPLKLEAQQQYFPYHARLVAIILRISFVLVFMGITRYVAE